MNFLQETIEAIKESGRDVDEVKCIRSFDGEFECTWEHFLTIANFDYDCGFGSQKIASDLILVFFDYTYFQRSEYDGSEEWEYNEPLEEYKGIVKPLSKLSVLGTDRIGWCSVSDLNSE